MKMENFKIDVDADGIALVTFDVPGRTMNTLTAQVIKEARRGGRTHQDRRDHQGRGDHLGQDHRLLRRRRPGRMGGSGGLTAGLVAKKA
jgi:3-hydroxyacyl-CoA dehydrogenase/enoyl-CoA hydratase/3-hydroxybutyryl-CoA epimerase